MTKDIYFYDEFEGKFSKIIREFLKNTANNFAKETMPYLRTEDIDFFPFIYGELVLNSVLLPALKKASDSSLVFTEFPVNRTKHSKEKNKQKNKNESQYGRVDYYVIHKDLDILIEVKFDWISYNSLKAENNNVKESLINNIKNASGQIKNIDWEDTIKISMLVAPVYIAKKVDDEDDFVDYIKNIDWDNLDKVYEDYHNRLNKEIKSVLGKKAQPFLISWDIPKFEKYYGCWERDDESLDCRAYPTIFFIGAILK